jgi:replicative DNA helicase
MRNTDVAVDRLPPQNIEAEQSVLGAILIENDAFPKALEFLTPEDFYREPHRKVFIAMIELFEKNEAVDLITVADVLTRKNELEVAGGIPYLSSLASHIPTAANIRYHSKIVKEKALLRDILRSTTEIASKVYESSLDAEELVDYAEKTIFDIADRRTKTPFSSLRDVIKSSFEMIEHLYNRKDTITGTPSGFSDLDELTTGFQPGDFIIIGGRPSMGKTALGLNIAQHVGRELKEPVAIFSLEMSKEQLAMRMLCAEAKVDSSSVRKGIFSKEDWRRLTGAAGRLAEAPIFIDDSSDITVLEMRAKARRLKNEHGALSLVVVDYLQLMRGRGSFERREQEISEISRSLKGLAKELKVPVIALSQLNRSVEQRENKRPNLSDLRESGAIEQDADVILFLYREEVYNKNSPSNRGKAEMIIAKQRNGPTAIIPLTFLSNCTKFVPSTDIEYQPEDVF